MSKVDKKLISLTLIFAMVFTIFSPLLVNAAETVPEGVIEFKDEGLFNALKNTSADKDGDGYITIKEMEAIETLRLDNGYVPIKSLEELSFAKNLKNLTIYNLDENITQYNLEALTNLEYFSIEKDVTDKNYKMDKENIKVPENVFIYDGARNVGETNSYYIYGISIKDKEVTVQKYDTYALDSYNQTIYKYAKIEDENIAKVASSVMIEGMNVGNTKIVFSSDLKTMEIPITVTSSDIEINNNPELEENGITSKLIYNRILMSNGDLWKVNSKDEAIKEDSGVLDYMYLRYRNDGYKLITIKLKTNGNLSILGYTDDVENSEDEIRKDVSNVKTLLVNKEYKVAYLDNNNDVYLIYMNLDERQIETKLIETDVEKVEGAFYVKDGNTYYLDGTLIAENVMDKANGHAFAIGNDLYSVKESYYGKDPISYEIAANDFESFVDDQYWEDYDVLYKSINGEIKTVSGDVRDEDEKFPSVTLFGCKINRNDVLCRHNLEYLTNVRDFIGIYENQNDYQPSYVIAVRTDGTVWTKKYNQITNFEKLISTESKVDLGNVDGDGEVNIKDVKLTLQYSLSKEDLSDVQIKAADVNKDGKVDIKDVRLILLYSLQKIDSFEEAK